MVAAETIRAVSITGPDRFEVVTLPPPVHEPGTTLARPAFVGLCGTDHDLFSGTMAYFAQGHARFPVQPGHEWSGTVIASDAGHVAGTRVIMDPIVGCHRCDICSSGQVVRCQDRFELGVRKGMAGALATQVAVPTSNLVAIPDGVSLRDAALVEPMVTSLEGIRRVDARPGEEALVVGAGTLGLLATMVLAGRGLRTHVLIRDEVRAAAVEAAGGLPWSSGPRPVARGFDVVIEAAGTTAGIRGALDSVAAGGRVALLGLPSATVEIDIAALVVDSVAVFGILSGPGQFQAGLEAIASGVVRPDSIIDRVYPFDQIEAALARSRQRGRPRPKVLVQLDPAAA